MNNNILKKINCGCVIKKIFSYIKVERSLKIIKPNKEIQNKIDISLFHYQYYYFFLLFKTEKIETIYDIIYSPYLKLFPKYIKYNLILKFIESRKLFKNDYIYLNINDENILSLIQKLNEKENINYIIGNIEEVKYDIFNKGNYHDKISWIIRSDENNINKILFDYDYFPNNKSSKNMIYKNIKYMNINLHFSGNTYDVSLFDNLEYLSLSLRTYNKYIYEGKIKIIISENQYKNIKTLKIIELKSVYYTIKNIIFTNEKNNENNFFENLKELYINEKLINKIKFNPKNLQKLHIIYDYRDFLYTIDYIENSINNIIEKYLFLTNLNISFYYKGENESNSIYELINEICTFFFNSMPDIENLSLNFYLNEYETCFIKKIRNTKLKFKFKGKFFPNFIESHLDKIEEIELSGYNKKYNLNIEENNAISSITKIRILNAPLNILTIQSFSSLKVLSLNIENIILFKEFPLFSLDSTIKFYNLEYLLLNTETIDIIAKVTNNFDNIQNLRFLCIICKYICSTVFPYHRDIIKKCNKLRRLNTLIIHNSILNEVNLVNIYYSEYPELKNTNIRFCVLSDNLSK